MVAIFVAVPRDTARVPAKRAPRDTVHVHPEEVAMAYSTQGATQYSPAGVIVAVALTGVLVVAVVKGLQNARSGCEFFPDDILKPTPGKAASGSLRQTAHQPGGSR